jgi:mono/diheme cytochrome c family protein
VGIGLGVIIAIVVLAVGGLYAVGSSKLRKTYEVETANLTIPTDSAAIARGAHLVRINGCVDCHTPNLGGQVFVDEPPFRIVASNLTRGAGGVGGNYDARTFDRAFRHGVRSDGTALLIMPAGGYHKLGDDDAAHIIAYLLSLPPVDNELPARVIRPLGRILSAFAIDPTFELNTTPARGATPAPGPTAEYGEYLTSVTCAYCHMANLRGGQPPIPDSPPSPDLAPVGKWAYELFEREATTGMSASGKVLDPAVMPWPMMAAMDDQERRAIHAFLATMDTTPVAPSTN